MRRLTMAGLVVMGGLACGTMRAQGSSGTTTPGPLKPAEPQGQFGRGAGANGGVQEDSSDAVYRKGIQERQEKARNEERQKKLVADTERLLALATLLHDDVAKTDKNILSLDVVKRTEEIEKLARSIKERMRN